MSSNSNHTASKKPKPPKAPLERNPYGTLLTSSNTEAHSAIVCDAAIATWMQMGLSEDQIIYGLAFLNIESGYNPQITNKVPTDTIRGLGQFNVATWNTNVQAFDKAYGIKPGGVGYMNPAPRITNANFTIANSYGTNAQAGEGVDPTAGPYDPQGLVPQLKALGMIIQSEWNPTNADQQNDQIDAMISAGVYDATLLKDPAGRTPIQDHAARAYLNHHEGSAWWDSRHRQATADKLNSKVDLPIAIEKVRQGVTDELNYLAGLKASSPNTYTGTAFDLMVGDPWTKANALPSVNEETVADVNRVIIEHQIPSIIPLGQEWFSETIGGLSAYSVTRPTRPDIPLFNKKGKQIGKRSQAPLVSYSYSTNGSLANDPSGAAWITNGAASYDFASGKGNGSAHFSDGSNLVYSLSTTSGFAYYTEQDVRTDASGKILYCDVDYTTKLGGTEIANYIEFTPTEVEDAYIQYSDLRSQTTVNAQYDKDGKLICVIKSNAAGLNIVERIATTDENYKDEAAKLGKIYNVPVFDPVVAAVKNGLSPKGNLSAQDAKGDVGLTSTVAQTAATAKADLRH